MSDLVEWLTKILDQDETVARAVKPLGEVVVMGGERHPESFGHVRYTVASEDGYPRTLGDPDARQHFALHDPAAVLADIAAKRAIIAEYVARDEDADLMLGPDCLRQREWSGLRLAVQLMATGYADRAGYRDEWKPLPTRTHP